MNDTPMHTPGPYFHREVEGSRDVDIVTLDGRVVARVMSGASGPDNEHDAETMRRNVALMVNSARMQQALDVVLERECEPMHPMIADSIRGLLGEIERGQSLSLKDRRHMDETHAAFVRTQAEEARAAALEQQPGHDEHSGDTGVDEGQNDEEGPEQSFGW